MSRESREQERQKEYAQQQYEEDREFNPYYSSDSDVEEYDNEKVDVNAAAKYDFEKREDETAKEREERLRLAFYNRRMSEKEKKNKKRSSSLGLNTGRVVSMVFVALFFSVAMCLGVYYIYMHEIKYPIEMPIVYEQTGSYCLRAWSVALGNLDGGISEFTGSSSYLENELEYANGVDIRKQFFRAMLDTVTYTPDTVVRYNKYGNVMLEEGTDEVVYGDSYVDEGEEITVSYIDYSAIELDSNTIKRMMRDEGVAANDPGYKDEIINLFCEYMLNLDELPTLSERHVPNMSKSAETGVFSMSGSEDVYLDRVLFSSDAFHELCEQFSLLAIQGEENPEYIQWSLLSKSAKKAKEEPVQYITELSPTSDWLTWDALSDDEKQIYAEPYKYDTSYVIGDTWCGAYYLQNEYYEVDASGNLVSKAVTAHLGNGTFSSPASLGTQVITSVSMRVKGENGYETEDFPIGVTMVEYGVSEDALVWFESKDERNRGKDINSENQYVYYIFEIENKSDRTLTVTDNSSLCDENVNLSSRTGVIYGLNDTVTLEPGETGRIETWSCSTVLNTKYIIWGADFSRQKDVVWFRKLAGDLEDISEDKGVTLNKTRNGDSEE